MSRGLTAPPPVYARQAGPQRTDLCAVGVVGAGLIAEMLFDLAMFRPPPPSFHSYDETYESNSHDQDRKPAHQQRV
jgi:hypothetical protein